MSTQGFIVNLRSGSTLTLQHLGFSSRRGASCCRLLMSSCCTAEKSNPAGELYEPRLSVYTLGIPTIVLAEVSASLFI